MSTAFDAILIQLEGTTILEKPRVSRETMLDVMRNHTELLRGVQKEITDVSALVGHIANEAAENKKQLKSIDETVTKNKNDIGELFNLLRGMRIEVDVIKKQVTELIVLKQEVQSQRDEMNEMKHKFEAHANNMVVYINKTTHAVAALDSKSNDVQLQLRELKEYVEHFGDNIVLASSQVTVESSAGYSERPISLLEVLKRCNTNITDLTTTCTEQEDKITANREAIGTKAGDECLFDIQTLQKKVSNIENHLKREEEQGISAIRKTCDNLKDEMGAIQTELSDKVRQKDVDDIVHKKYEDIVQYLQDALRASETEEESFAKRAEDLEERLQKIAASKADRQEVAPMMEIVVKTEAMLSKLNQSNKDKEKLKDMYSKKEIEALLELKVDKVEYEERMREALKAARKSKKLSVMGGGLPTIDDNSTYATLSSNNSSLPTTLNSTTPTNNNNPPSNMWKGLAEGYKEESKAAVFLNNSDVAEDNLQKQQMVLQQQMHLVQQQQSLLISQLQEGGGGTAGGAGGGGVDQAQLKQQLQEAQAMQQHLAQQLQQVQLSQSNVARQHVNNSPLAVSGTTPADFSAFVKGKKGIHGKAAGPAANLPSNTNPGAFRTATEGGIAGGDGIPPNSLHGIDHPVELQYYPNVPPDSRVGHDMSFLGGPYAGGGFNLRQQKLGTQSLRPLGMVAADSVDIEGSGLMLKGTDGKFYYTDTMEGEVISTASNGPNVKQLKSRLSDDLV